MPVFRFKLEPVLRYRRSRRDLCRQYLAQVLADDRKLLEQRDRLQKEQQRQLEELRGIGKAGTISVEGATTRRYYIGQLVGEIRLVDHNRTIVAGQLELCHKWLAQAEKDMKVLEKLRDKQASAVRDVQLHREEFELEEAWQAAHVGQVNR